LKIPIGLGSSSIVETENPNTVSSTDNRGSTISFDAYPIGVAAKTDSIQINEIGERKENQLWINTMGYWIDRYFENRPNKEHLSLRNTYKNGDCYKDKEVLHVFRVVFPLYSFWAMIPLDNPRQTFTNSIPLMPQKKMTVQQKKDFLKKRGYSTTRNASKTHDDFVNEILSEMETGRFCGTDVSDLNTSELIDRQENLKLKVSRHVFEAFALILF